MERDQAIATAGITVSEAEHVIWKYQLFEPRTCLMMPQGARILTMQEQAGVPTLWAAVNPTAPLEKREFATVGTGHSFNPRGMEYIATWFQGPFVWHLFERYPWAG